jgi:hypothetical protein
VTDAAQRQQSTARAVMTTPMAEKLGSQEPAR